MYLIWKVLAKPEEILPEGLFEGDIVLSKEQAEDIFSEDISDDATRKKRKVINNSANRWSLTQMPIIYMFDGTHRTFKN